jgi:Domain of unknown function (DUF4398)
MDTSNSRFSKRGTHLAMLALLVATAAGCATPNAPTDQMAVTRSAVADAISAGAPEYSPVELKNAQDRLDAANVAMGSKDYDAARNLSEEAEADANLAAAHARSVKAQRAAAEVQESIRALQNELVRANRQP